MGVEEVALGPGSVRITRKAIDLSVDIVSANSTSIRAAAFLLTCMILRSDLLAIFESRKAAHVACQRGHGHCTDGARVSAALAHIRELRLDEVSER